MIKNDTVAVTATHKEPSLPDELIRRNREWAGRINEQSPEYFRGLAALQRPDYFWIGCADARVPANVIAGLEPGEVFVHRNVANIVHSADLNVLSALQFAIEGIGIRKIIVCGHYGCGGVNAACADHLESGLVDHWIEPIRSLRRLHAAELEPLDGPSRADRLAELNVLESVTRVAETPILRKAWARGLPIEIHGMIYSLVDGRLTLLESASRSR
ncbi:carbonate dehydratase [Luminiphilus syltensis NOR5-1B]|uniref:Carbonic anhydrase n=1 Tax=Luminiphilus syltensis NOR5-1B TaxID=565045 RepID=B8KVE3_9GAMM|nr:carbonic anhydrase [Luminiphilus syltensis]EED34868.1 carbonate dehydratase [Luminiphilus syltensis NOR5-1B]